MEGVADFLDTLLSGIDLTCYSLTVGAVFWAVWILRPWARQGDEVAIPVQFSVKTLYLGAFGLAAIQLLQILVKAWLIAETLGRWPFPAFAHTIQFGAGLWRAVFALLLALYASIRLVKTPDAKRDWTVAACIVVLLIATGGWLVHGAGRFESRTLLMVLTVLHQVGAAIWLGGIVQLMGLWRLTRRHASIATLWPILLARFSAPGIAAVLLLVITGTPLAWLYIDTWTGLFGTGYGNLLVVKLWLVLLTLAFAVLNYCAAQRCKNFGLCGDVNRRVPYYLEAETFVLITILFTAASLSAQPPSVDIPELTASWSEVIHTFTPRIPKVTSPTHEALLAGEAGRTAIVGQVPSRAATEWSDYNHNMSGIILFVISIAGLLSYSPRFPMAKFWPLGFAVLSVFIFFRADAESWPLGPTGFWESTVANGEILQHRLAALLTLALAVFEYRARRAGNRDSSLPYVFPILAAFGGLLLLTHSHVGFQAKTEFLIQIGHTAMGLLAIILACGRWLELRLEPPINTTAGIVSISAMLLISFILMFYREPVY